MKLVKPTFVFNALKDNIMEKIKLMTKQYASQTYGQSWIFDQSYNKMKLSRVKSSHNTMPVRQQAISFQRQQLRQKTRELQSRPSSAATTRNKFTDFTRASRSIFQTYTQHAKRSATETYSYNFERSPQSRTLTHSTSRCHQVHSPLSVARGRSKCQCIQESPKIIGTKEFLRKGSAIDKAVISNILRSKLNKNGTVPAYSYSDQLQNQQLASLVFQRIPQGIRDVVGTEEMLRMSHIFTGTQAKTVSLIQCINQGLKDAKLRARNRKKSEDQQSITLRSIERW